MALGSSGRRPLSRTRVRVVVIEGASGPYRVAGGQNREKKQKTKKHAKMSLSKNHKLLTLCVSSADPVLSLTPLAGFTSRPRLKRCLKLPSMPGC